jgi:hypothetical protein
MHMRALLRLRRVCVRVGGRGGGTHDVLIHLVFEFVYLGVARVESSSTKVPVLCGAEECTFSFLLC